MKILNRKLILVLALMILGGVGLSAAEPGWGLYAEILKEYVKSGRGNRKLRYVNYRGLKKDARWKKVVHNLENFPISRLRTPEARLAFYIDAYNIFALNTILKNYPIKSIHNITKPSGKIWNEPAGKLGGKQVSLNFLENKIIRNPKIIGYLEPRIHFAVVCASYSCPDLRNEPFRASRLERQLEEQTISFLNNSTKGNRLNKKYKTLRYSKIFEWYAKDFKSVGGGKAFILKYRKDIPKNCKIGKPLPYNWSLNGK